MVFEKSLRRELLAAASGVFVTLLTIVLTNSLIRILGQAAAGKVGAESVILLIGFAALNTLPMILVLTVFIAVLLVVSRMYRDAEMVVWFSSGVALNDLIRPVLRFAVPVAGAAFAFSMVVTPWANQQSNELRARFEQRDEVAKVSAGQFIESAEGRRVFFVENLDEERGMVDNVFVAMRDDSKLSVVVARHGHVEAGKDGERFIALDAGRRYEGEPGSPRYSVMEFDRYSVRLSAQEVSIAPPGAETRTMTAGQVVAATTPQARGELMWRVSIPIYALNLALLAIPLAYMNPRAGRSANLIFAILIFVIYQSLVQLGISYVGSGRLPFAVGWWLVHGIVAFAATMLFLRRRSAASLSWLSWRTWRVCLGRAQRRRGGGMNMRVLGRYLAREILLAVAFVLLALVALFFVLDLIQELQDVGKAQYQLQHAMLYVLFELPSVAYQVMPIAALIGTIYALAQFAANSEYTIMRASGLSTVRAARTIAGTGIVLVALTFVIGEYAAPPAEAYARTMKLSHLGQAASVDFRSGFWVKDVVLDDHAAETGVRFVNANQVEPDGTLRQVRLYEFDRAMRLRSLGWAESAQYQPGSGWRLHDLTETRFVPGTRDRGLFAGQELVYETRVSHIKEGLWPARIDANVFASVFVEPKDMSVVALWKYIDHLRETRQKTLKYEIALWSKGAYPAAVVVMMLLGLPFAYLHTRSGGVSLKIFAGIMLGIGFYVVNSLAAHLGVLRDWPASMAALVPSLLALAVAAAWLRWVERH